VRLILQTNPGLTYTFLEVLASALTRCSTCTKSSAILRNEEKPNALTMGQCPYTLREVLKTSGSIAESAPKEVLKTSGPSTAQRSTHAEHLANPTQWPQPEAAFPVPASDEAAKLSLRNENKAHEGQLNSQNAAQAAEPPCMSNHGNTAVIGQLDRGSLESLTQTSHELEESHTLPPASSIGLS
jgi:hypothetical protein